LPVRLSPSAHTIATFSLFFSFSYKHDTML
jgi:hypothetical protein